MKVVPVDAQEPKLKRRFGFLEGQIIFPEDRAELKAIGADEIAAMSEGGE